MCSAGLCAGLCWQWAYLHKLRAGQSSDGGGGWTYEYVPGAGDDEESWAKGLTPSLLYTHQEVSSFAPAHLTHSPSLPRKGTPH